MQWMELLGGGVGGGAGLWLVQLLRDLYFKKRDGDLAEATLAVQVQNRERDATGEVAIEDRADRRRMEEEVRSLHAELREFAVANARLEAEKKSLLEDQEDRDTLLELVKALRTQVDMQSQLIERQKKQIDDLVRRLMTRDSIPPVPA